MTTYWYFTGNTFVYRENTNEESRNNRFSYFLTINKGAIENDTLVPRLNDGLNMSEDEIKKLYTKNISKNKRKKGGYAASVKDPSTLLFAFMKGVNKDSFYPHTLETDKEWIVLVAYSVYDEIVTRENGDAEEFLVVRINKNTFHMNVEFIKADEPIRDATISNKTIIVTKHYERYEMIISINGNIDNSFLKIGQLKIVDNQLVSSQLNSLNISSNKTNDFWDNWEFAKILIRNNTGEVS